jgi:hypothetical protein
LSSNPADGATGSGRSSRPSLDVRDPQVNELARGITVATIGAVVVSLTHATTLDAKHLCARRFVAIPPGGQRHRKKAPVFLP